VLDANGNQREIGTTTSDVNGYFTFVWKPDISGTYTLYASFDGSESYWASSAVTSFYSQEPSPTPTSQPSIALPPTEMYIIGATAAIIIAIAVGFALTVMILKRRP
jgi:hypothetical protein